MRSPLPPLLVLLALLLLAGRVDAAADQVTIYRCTSQDGALALRDTPCKPGERQQAIEMQRPQDPPPRSKPRPVADPAPPPAPPPQVVTHVVVVERPEPVYECTTADGEQYASDSNAGNPRWVPLWTLGYPARPPYAVPRRPFNAPVRPASNNDYLTNDLVFDGIGRPSPPPPGDRPRAPELPPAVGLAYSPGAWIRDRCRRLTPVEACQRLRDQHSQLGRSYNSATQRERRQIDAEQQAITVQLDRQCAG